MKKAIVTIKNIINKYKINAQKRHERKKKQLEQWYWAYYEYEQKCKGIRG